MGKRSARRKRGRAKEQRLREAAGCVILERKQTRIEPFSGNWLCWHGMKGKKMNIPIVYDDETENEFDIELCCVECAKNNYGWSGDQFQRVLDSAEKGTPLKVPNRVKSEAALREFVKGNL